MAPALYDDKPITSRAPKLYLKLEENPPTDSAGAGYGGTISVKGTPTAHGVSTKKGKGIRLGAAASIQADHHTVFETAGATKDNTIVESEVTFSIHCAFPAPLQNDWVIFSKDDDQNTFAPGLSLRVHRDGSVEMRVREHKYRPDVRMKTAAGVVTQGGEHHFTVSLGYEGAWFTVDGRQAELGFKNNLAWWGLDHRHNGVEEGGQAESTRVTNRSAIRLGRTGDQSTSADIVVTKFAVFYGGVVRTTRGQQTAGLTLADAQALAGAGGDALPDPRFSAVSRSPAAGADTIQAAIDAATPNGTVILSGTYKQTKDLVLKTGVRITTDTGSSATIILSGPTTKLMTAFPTSMPKVTGGGTLASGAQTYSATNSATNDDIFLVVDKTPIGELYNVAGVHNIAAKKSDLIPIRSNNGSSFTFTRAPYFKHNAATRLATCTYEPSAKDVAIDGNITIRKDGGKENTPTVQFNAIRRGRFNNITIEQISTTDVSVIGLQCKGCVELSFSGCTITNTSPQGVGGNHGHFHPYAFKLDGCAHYDVFDHTGMCVDWNTGDNESDNADDEWRMPRAVDAEGGVLWGGNFGTWRKCTMASINKKFNIGTHTCNGMDFIDLLYTKGGGFSCNGYAHNYECIECVGPGGNSTQIAMTRGCGAVRMWHCNFNNGLGNWGNGECGMTKCDCGDLHYRNPPQRSNFGRVPHDGSNVFTDVDKSRKSEVAPTTGGNHDGFPF